MRRIGIIIISFLLLASCKREHQSKDPDPGKVVTAHFSFTTAPMQQKGVATRSTPSSTVDDQQITDMWVIQFDNSGTFLRKSYSHNINPAAFDVQLSPNASGTTSNIYFLANNGPTLDTPTNEAAFKTQTKTITQESDLFISGSSKKNIPMFGQLLTQTVPGSGYMETMNVTLMRMLAQVDFTYTIDASITSSFILEQVRVCNVPNMQYYAPGTGNFPASPSSGTVIHLPLETATAPGPTTVTFYLPDNRRGVGANTAGTNERLKSGVDYATYIELIGHLTTGAPDVAEFRYRIYPGADKYNDYNLVRNTKYSLSTTLKGISASDSRVHVVSANCYMLKPGGSVNIPVSRANESNLGTQIADVSTGWKAAINWETTAGLVTLDYNTYLSSGYFKVTAPSTTAKGNAEVVVTDAAGTNVLWSWHIWVTDYDPTLSANVDVLNGNTWMKYNLGATALANGSNSFATSGGLMYQWGRKDPFPNSNTVGDNVAPISLSGFTMPAYTGLTTTAVTNDTYVKYADASASPISYTNQLAYSVKYPMLFLSNWSGSTATAAGSSTVGISSWGGEYGDSKSVYDPCPAGWRVSSGKKASTTYVSPWSTWTTNTSTDGVNTAYAVWASTGYYPLSGYRNNNGTLCSVGYCCYSWSAPVSYLSNAYLMSLYRVDMYPVSKGYRYLCFSVRCVKAW